MYNFTTQCSLLRNAVDERQLIFAVTNGTDEETCCLLSNMAVAYLLRLVKQFLICVLSANCVCSVFNTKDIAHSRGIYS